MKKLSTCILCCSLFVSVCPAEAATIQESFQVNTSSLAGVAGGIDLAFNPGVISKTQAATATVTLFGGAAVDPAIAASNTGHASGSLPGMLQFDNGTIYNDVFTPVVFGSSFHFVLTLSGAAVNTPDPAAVYGSVFTLGLFSSDGNTPRVTADGILASVDLTAASATAVAHTFPASGSLASVTAVVPEPATVALVPLAVLLAALTRHRRRAGTMLFS